VRYTAAPVTPATARVTTFVVTHVRQTPQHAWTGANSALLLISGSPRVWARSSTARIVSGHGQRHITMGCGDACPIFPGKRYEDWELDDPAGQDVAAVRVIRDQIDERVQRLMAELLPAER